MKQSTKKISKFFSTLFVKGLLTILPIAITLGLLNLIFKGLVSWLAPLKVFEPEFLHRIPYAEILIAIAIIFFTGFLINLFFLKWILHAVEQLLFKIPLIRPLYSGIKQLVHAFSPQDDESFKQVVAVEFPREGLYCIGFLTSELPAILAPRPGKKYYNVFIPTTPNPTTGYYIIVSADDISHIDLTRQEAMALIISGGIIKPERFKEQPTSLRHF